MARRCSLTGLCGTLLLATAIAACLAGPAAAQYPDKPVRLVVPFTAGGSPDTTARRVAQRLTQELKQQFVYCQRIAAALGLRVLADPVFEADDLIGSVVHALRRAEFRAVIVSADKDFGQLITEHDEQWDFSRNQRWDSAGVKDRLGVHPHQVADFLALTGDAIDNIPGVAGIGAKTAATLLAHFGDLDAIYARIEEVPFLRFRGAAAAYAKLKAGAASARLSRSLTGIACDCPVPADAAAFTCGKPDLAEAEALLEQLRFGPLTRSRIRALA